MSLLRSIILAVCAGSLASCYYPAYDAGYSSSVGYSGGGAAFVHTSSDRWFYDSSVRCYYDRTRGSYYDPWLNGYYPSGYCPRPVAHVPHPYGWNGRGACPPPRGVRYGQINRYQDRVALLQAKNHAWARNVKLQQQANAYQWQKQRAKVAAQFAANGNRPGARTGTYRGSPVSQPSFGGNGRSNPSQQAVRPPSTSGNPFRHQAQPTARPGRQVTPQITRPSRQQPTRPTPQVTKRPGYNQPVKAPAPRPQPTRSSSSNRSAADQIRKYQQQNKGKPTRRFRNGS